MRASTPAACTALFLSGCSVQPADLPTEPRYMIVVKSAQLPKSQPRYTRFASHAYLDLKIGSEHEWMRLEVGSGYSGRSFYEISSQTARKNIRWGRDVVVHQVMSGPGTKAIISETIEASKHWDKPERYRAWPGPNSNTFVARILRETSGLGAELDHDAVGADYPESWVTLRRTTTGWGLQFDATPIGVQVGLLEGVELHFLQLTFGVSFWPPSIKLPALPRLGF